MKEQALIIKKLIHTLNLYEDGTVLVGNQGQALDGYSALTEFIEIAKQAKTAGPDPTIEQAKTLFDCITCLCVEGPEVTPPRELREAILKDALRGYYLCKSTLEGDK